MVGDDKVKVKSRGSYGSVSMCLLARSHRLTSMCYVFVSVILLVCQCCSICK